MKKKKNTNGLTAIYVRRSVSDRDNKSLSIEAQKEDCIRYVGDCEYRIYCDNGFSGKDTEHRPSFQQMMSDARDGLISRIVVKKYDRFSRNLRDYLNVSEELDKLGVTVYSLSEPFNTETKEGRMMRNNLLNFAEFERETIAGRVADSYNTKARETGFYQGGKMYFGYVSERMTVGGKTGSVLVPSEQAEAVRIAYEMYQNPSTSLRDIITYFSENHIVTQRTDKYKSKKAGIMTDGHLTKLLESPLYVRADKEVYAYFVSKGYEIFDDISAYDGVHGIFIHENSDGGYYVKVGYHEGIVSSAVWLAVQDKKSHNRKFPNNTKTKKSWLTGLTKCAHCGYSIYVNCNRNKAGTKEWRYLIDFGWLNVAKCKRRTLKLRPETVEDAVLQAMRERIDLLVIVKQETEKPDTDMEKIKADIICIDEEIHKLMDKLADADTVLFDYIQQRVSTLHEKKSELERKLQTKARKCRAIDTKPLEEPMSRWESLTMQEKHDLAATMIDVILVSDETGIDIKFSI